MNAQAVEVSASAPFENGGSLRLAVRRQDFRHTRSATTSRLLIPAHNASVGGDWCETFLISDGILALSIGDVCGHGLAAHRTMRSVRQSVRNALKPGVDPASALLDANRLLFNTLGDDYATAIVGLFDTISGTFAFANAGHPPPLVVGPGGSVFLSAPQSDLPLGIEADAVPAVRTLNVPAQSLLVLYTDGLVYGPDDLIANDDLRRAAIAAYRQPGESAARGIRRRIHANAGADDVAILTLYFAR